MTYKIEKRQTEKALPPLSASVLFFCGGFVFKEQSHAWLNRYTHSQRLKHAAYGVEPRVAVFAQGFIQTVTSDACLLGYVAHAFSSCGSVQRTNEFLRGAVLASFEQEGLYVFVCFEKGSNVECFSFHYLVLLELVHQLSGLLYVFALAGFIASTHQKNNLLALKGVVDAKPSCKEQAEFVECFAQVLMITKVSMLHTQQAVSNTAFGGAVFDGVYPVVKGFGAGEFVHDFNCILEDTVGQSGSVGGVK